MSLVGRLVSPTARCVRRCLIGTGAGESLDAGFQPRVVACFKCFKFSERVAGFDLYDYAMAQRSLAGSSFLASGDQLALHDRGVRALGRCTFLSLIHI